MRKLAVFVCCTQKNIDLEMLCHSAAHESTACGMQRQQLGLATAYTGPNGRVPAPRSPIIATLSYYGECFRYIVGTRIVAS